MQAFLTQATIHYHIYTCAYILLVYQLITTDMPQVLGVVDMVLTNSEFMINFLGTIFNVGWWEALKSDLGCPSERGSIILLHLGTSSRGLSLVYYQ